MSRGLGRIESAIAAAFLKRPDHAHSVAELATIVFPRTKTITKSQRVSVIRAADKVGLIMGRRKVVGGTPREAHYRRVPCMPLAEDTAPPVASRAPEFRHDEVAERVAEHLVAFLKGVLDPSSVQAFVNELERTTVEHLRARLRH